MQKRFANNLSGNKSHVISSGENKSKSKEKDKS